MAYVVQTSLTNSQLSSLPAKGKAVPRKHVLARMMEGYRLWRRRRLEQELLTEMSDRELADFGANRCDVYREIARPFWTLPPM